MPRPIFTPLLPAINHQPDLNLQLRAFALAHGQQRVIPATDHPAGASFEAERLGFPWGEEAGRNRFEIMLSSGPIAARLMIHCGASHTFDFSIGRVLFIGVENGTICLHM